MERYPLTRKNPEAPLENEIIPEEIHDKAARIRKLAVSKALEPSLRRQGGAPNISLERHPEAFNLQPINRANTEESAENKLLKTETSQLTTPELLQIAAKLSVEGKSVRTMYESNRIDYRGLHAIIKEALRGGNIKAVFEKHKLGEEARRGRKIELRHDDPSKTPHVIKDYDAPSHKVSELIEKVEAHQHKPLTTANPPNVNEMANQPSLSDQSHQKAKQALRQKRIVIATAGMVLGIGIGLVLALVILRV